MEKISGIVPSSPRTRKVDVSSSQPVRPGAPEFGRHVGKNSLAENTAIDRIQLGVNQLPDLPGYKNKTDKIHAQLVADMNRKFFAKDPKQITEEIRSQMANEQKNESQSFKELSTNSTNSLQGLKSIAQQPMTTPELAEVVNDQIELTTHKDMNDKVKEDLSIEE